MSSPAAPHSDAKAMCVRPESGTALMEASIVGIAHSPPALHYPLPRDVWEAPYTTGGGGAPDAARVRRGDLAVWPDQAAVDELVARPEEP